MADIINFKEYIELHKGDRKRFNQISLLSEKNEKKVEELLHNISNNMGCSITTIHLNEMNQVVERKTQLTNSDLLDVIINSLKEYTNKIYNQNKKNN